MRCMRYAQTGPQIMHGRARQAPRKSPEMCAANASNTRFLPKQRRAAYNMFCEILAQVVT